MESRRDTDRALARLRPLVSHGITVFVDSRRSGARISGPREGTATIAIPTGAIELHTTDGVQRHHRYSAPGGRHRHRDRQGANLPAAAAAPQGWRLSRLTRIRLAAS